MSVTTELFPEENGYDINAGNNVRIRLYNTDVINSIIKKLIVHSPVGKLVQYNMSLFSSSFFSK